MGHDEKDNESILGFKLDNMLTPRLETKPRNEPRMPLTSLERKFMLAVMYPQCLDALKARFVKSGFIDPREINEMAPGATIIVMNNIMDKFDKYGKVKNTSEHHAEIGGRKLSGSIDYWLTKKNAGLDSNGIFIRNFDGTKVRVTADVVQGKDGKKPLEWYFLVFFQQGINQLALSNYRDRAERTSVNFMDSSDLDAEIAMAQASDTGAEDSGLFEMFGKKIDRVIEELEDELDETKEVFYLIFMQGLHPSELREKYTNLYSLLLDIKRVFEKTRAGKKAISRINSVISQTVYRENKPTIKQRKPQTAQGSKKRVA